MACGWSSPREPAFLVLACPGVLPKELPYTSLGTRRSRRTRLHCSNFYTQTSNHPFKPSTPPRPCSQPCSPSFRLQTRPCMLSRGVASHTKRTRPTAIAADAYRSVVCTYLCAALLWRVLATVLETCSLSELLKGRAIRAVPSLGTASYKTCHRKKHGARRRH